MPMAFIRIILFASFLAFCTISQAQERVSSSSVDTSLANKYYTIAEGFFKSDQCDSSNLYFEKAAKIYKKAAERDNNKRIWSRYVNCYNRISHNYWRNLQYKEAMVSVTHALQTGKEKLGEINSEVAKSCRYLGNIFADSLKHEQAEQAYLKSLKINTALYGKLHSEVATDYGRLGVLAIIKTDYDEAIVHLKESVNIFHQISSKDPLEVALIHMNFGNACRKKGDMEAAIKNYAAAVEFVKLFKNEDNTRTASVYGNIATVYIDCGDYHTALDYLNKALAIQKNVLGETHWRVASNYSKLGNAYHKLGEFDKAIENYTNALKIFSKLGIREYPGEIENYYNDIGCAYMDQGEYQTAQKYLNKSLSVRLDYYGENHLNIASSYTALADLKQKQGDPETSKDYLLKSLVIRRNKLGEIHPDVSNNYLKLGELFFQQSQYDSALIYTQRAILAVMLKFANMNVYANPPLQNILSEKELLNALELKANVFQKLYLLDNNQHQNIETCLSTYKLISELIERIQIGYRSEGSKFFLKKKTTGIYENAIQASLLAASKNSTDIYTKEAFRFSEKNHATVLAQSLQESRAKQFAGIPSELLEKEKRLRIDLAFYETEILKERVKAGQQDLIRLQKFESRHFSLKREYDQLMDQFGKTYPAYYNLKYKAHTASVADLQNVLDDQTALIEYFLGDSSIFIFAVTHNDFEVIIIKRDQTFNSNISSLATYFKSLSSKDSYIKSADLLFQLLIKPVETRVKNKFKWIIIPDGELYQIPFEVLLNQPVKEADRYQNLPYLIKDHEISYHYSATLWLNSRKTRPHKLYANDFAGFAPVFADGNSNGRILETHRSVFDTTRRDWNVSTVTFDGKQLNPLPNSEKELESIVEMWEQYRKKGVGFFHNEATEEHFKALAGNYKYIHIATHGFVIDRLPNFSGIIFSQPGMLPSPEEDGILFSSEAYNLKLKADLVVLSSCESGLGTLVRGEGLMALTRGFLYSGASNVIVSLWKVPDKPTSALMIELYRYILEGNPYSSALREAKLKMLADPATAAPHSWASFVLIGR